MTQSLQGLYAYQVSACPLHGCSKDELHYTRSNTEQHKRDEKAMEKHFKTFNSLDKMSATTNAVKQRHNLLPVKVQ